MNNDKLTTIDDEILDNVSGGASVGAAIGDVVGDMIDGSIKVVDTLVEGHIKRHQRFWNNLAKFNSAI